MTDRLHPSEIVEGIRLVMSTLSMMTSEGALAAVILTNQAYDEVKTIFRNNAVSYRPGEIDLDPGMDHSFVVDGLIFLRGTTKGSVN